MNTYHIDARGCGTGKTTTNIYPRLSAALESNKTSKLKTHILVVVPSQDLQQQYKSAYPSALIINSTTDNGNVSSALIEHLKNPQNTICVITHAAFKLTHIRSDLKAKFILIQDEAFDPYRVVTWSNCNPELNTIAPLNKKLLTDFVKNTSLHSTDEKHMGEIFQGITANVYAKSIKLKNAHTLLDNHYHELTFDPSAGYFDMYDSFTGESPSLVKLVDTQWHTVATSSSIRKMLSMEAPAKGTVGTSAEFFQYLKPSITQGWKSYLICAADFTNTLQYAWMKKFNSDYKFRTDKGHTFKKMSLPLDIHVADFITEGSSPMWSKSLAARQPQIIKNYTDAVNNMLNGEPVLSLRNNGSQNKLMNETRLSHSSHGINSYTSFTNISLESAIIPSNGLRDFLKDFIGVSKDKIGLVFNGQIFYQALMRTALRDPSNTRRVNLFILDPHAASNMLHYFSVTKSYSDQPDIQPDIQVGYEKRVALTEEEKLANSRLAVIKCRSKNKVVKVKKPPMTPAERKQKFNMKKAVEKALARTNQESLNNLLNKGV